MDVDRACEECYKIKCKKCGWVAKEKEVFLIQQGKLTTCPICGWSPRSS